jgi:hypothetical protein
MSIIRIQSETIQRTLQQTRYLQGLTQADMIARKYDMPKDSLLSFYMQHITPYEADDTGLQLIQKANTLLQPFRSISKIPWKIAMFDPVLENGFPHTHGDIIFLPKAFFTKPANPLERIKTLIHEKIHVYQRLYPAETNHLIINIQQSSIRQFRQQHSNAALLRSNPDINDIIYDDNAGEEIVSLYTSDQPSSMIDVIDKKDHPYELMAYYLSHQIVSQSLHDVPKGMLQWTQKYL